MTYLAISRLAIVEEDEATGDVAQIYDDIRRTLETPSISNFFTATAGSPAVLAGTWAVMHQVYLQGVLPASLKALILYAIAMTHQCRYCSAVHQATCRSLGIDEALLETLIQNLDILSPRRVREIIRFSIKCADDAINLTEADYDRVRRQGIGDEELMEIIAVAALGNYLDTLADAMKIEIDAIYQQVLQN